MGTGIVVLLNAVDELVRGRTVDTEATGESSGDGPGMDYVFAYSITVALVLVFTTFYGWIELETDPTLMVGGAFFIIGFDARKTWIAGVARILGLVGGTLIGLSAATLLGPGVPLDVVMIAACGLSFGAFGVHPGAWMFFFMIFVAAGWQGLEPEAFDLTVRERFYGETVGVIAAMAALVFLQWMYNRRLSRTQ